MTVAKEEKKTSVVTCKAVAAYFIGTFFLRFIFAVVYFRQVGLSSTYSGILQGASPLSTAIGGIIMGYIADRADLRKPIFVMSYFCYAITPFLLTLPEPANHCLNMMHSDSQVANTSLALHRNSTYHPAGSSGLKVQIQNDDELKTTQQLQIYENNLFKGTGRFLHEDDHSTPDSFHSVKTFPNNFTKLVNIPTSEENSDVKRLFIILLIITIISDFFAGVSINLADNIMLSAYEDKKQYGKVRVWGNITQTITIPFAAILTYFKRVEICGEAVGDFKLALYVTSIISGTGWLMTIFKVHLPSSKHDEQKKHGTSSEATLKGLISPLGTWSLIIIAFFYGAFRGGISSFLFWTMIDLDQNQANLSIAVANFARNAAGLLVVYFSPQVLHKIGHRNTMSIACLVFGIGFIVAAVMRSSWLGIIVEMFGGAGFAFAVAACVSYIGEVAHPSLAVTAQGMCWFYRNMKIIIIIKRKKKNKKKKKKTISNNKPIVQVAIQELFCMD